MSVKWDYDATAALRYGRKYDGPWEDGSIPDDGDTCMIIAAPQVAADYAALKSQYEDLIRVVRNIEIHFEQLCSDNLREHGSISKDHGIDFQVFRALCGYDELMEENAALEARYTALRDAVMRLIAADDAIMQSWHTMANNGPLEDEFYAARAEVDRLLGEL